MGRNVKSFVSRRMRQAPPLCRRPRVVPSNKVRFNTANSALYRLDVTIILRVVCSSTSRSNALNINILWTSVEQVAKVFTAATHQRVWDHFTKPQRKNIETWQKMTQVTNTHWSIHTGKMGCNRLCNYMFIEYLLCIFISYWGRIARRMAKVRFRSCKALIQL